MNKILPLLLLFCSVSLFVLFTLVVAAQGLAATFGNPVPDFEKGQMGIGLGLSDSRATFFVDYGLTDPGTLRLLAGTLEVGRADGTEFGAGYRHRLDETFEVAEQTVRLGGFGHLRIGQVEAGGSDAGFNQVDVGFGGSIEPVENLRPYGAVVYQRVDVDVDTNGKGKGGGGTDTDLGAVIGAEFLPSPEFLIGIELHLGFDEDDIAIFGEIKF